MDIQGWNKKIQQRIRKIAALINLMEKAILSSRNNLRKGRAFSPYRQST